MTYVPNCEWSSIALPKSMVKQPSPSVKPKSARNIRATSEPPPFRAARPLAASPRHKNRVSGYLTLDHPRQQSHLNLQQPPVTHPILKQRVRHQRIHPQLIRPEEPLPPRRRQP